MSGLATYSSLYAIVNPKNGDTIPVSVASRAVGQTVGQLAKCEVLTVTSSVGSDYKLVFIIKKLNLEGGFNYKNERPGKKLAKLAPQGLDIC